MAPSPQPISRDTTGDDSSASTVPPLIIAGIAFAGCILLGLGLWLGIYTYKKRNRARILAAEGATSESDEKGFARPRPPRPIVKGAPHFSRDQLTSSIVLPHRPDATKDEILQHYIASGTITRPFSSVTTTRGATALASPTSPNKPTMRPVSTVSFLSTATRTPSPRRTSFFGFGGNRPVSMASSVLSTVSSVLGGAAFRKVRQLFSPVLPDELVVSLGERLTVVKSFDDGWCIVGRDSLIKPGDVEMGAVPSWCFVKPVKGLKASRPMRTTSLGVTVEIEAGPGFSSREEVISWSNF